MSGDEVLVEIQGELRAMLADAFPGLNMTVEHSERWDRPCVTFAWSGFRGLLPEERFHRLVQAIPESFRTARMSGFVWLELAPGERVDAFLKLPRSEDVADKGATIYAGLCDAGFFDALRKRMGRSPQKTCRSGFAEAEVALGDKKYNDVRRTEVKLLFIRHGVYCDCQVLETLEPELARLHSGAA